MAKMISQESIDQLKVDNDQRRTKLNSQISNGKPQATPTMRGLSVRVYRHYGAIDIEFGVTAQFDPENEADQQRLWQMLYQQVNDMHDDWAQNELPNVKPLSKVGQGSKASNGGEPETYKAVAIRKSETGKYKVVSEPGTKYGKFGAALSDRLVQEMNLDQLLDGSISINLEHQWFTPDVSGVVHKLEGIPDARNAD